MEEALISKLKKLKSLADRGVAGEAINAKKILHQLLDKYNLCYEEIFDEETRKAYVFSYSSKEEKKLFFHCVANVFGTKSEIWKTCFHYKNGEMKQYLRLTSLEYALFNDFYEFHRRYWKEYIKKQMSLLMKAYIESQHIYDISPREDDEDISSNKSAYDMREIMAILALSEQMKDHVPQYRKSLK